MPLCLPQIDGSSPLHITCAAMESEAIARLLLKAGVSVNACRVCILGKVQKATACVL